MPNNHKDYDEEPVTYCSRCYSLKIAHEDVTDTDCCMNCGCTEVKETDITTWERMYTRRYGHKFTEKSNDPKDSMYFKMSISKLKDEVYKSKSFLYLIRKLYPKFPQGLGKADMVILLFDKLSKDNRIDDLRYLLYENNR